ncbi:MAG: ABC transporter ATP-binding protein [Phycisphaerales bacterium]|nr:ABC transporter ATP-binding protein [Phycisphaerales bacterium]MCI0631192.1 ABC transporter ATP-binding protein [Phycisphaerales bacterium]MCI0676417.1 ABC transporter ATP-binding protein [Phycisphaerales bacterium]
MAEVVLENLCKDYPARRGGDVNSAVKNLNLKIGDGELLALVGPSGCGKTTTLRLIAGLDEPTSGKIQIGERQVNDLPPRDRRVAMVFQDYALYPHMTVRQNIAFGLKMRRRPRAEIDDRVNSVGQALNVVDLLDRKPGALSGGQRQRAALGRALAQRPECLLLDEPLSNLDAQLRAQVRSQIKSIHQQFKTTMIHVTHDQEEAMVLADRIAVMNRGEIHQIDQPMEVYRKPANRFVAGFFGSPAMNFIDGRIERIDGHVTFTDERSLRLAAPSAAVNSLLPFIGRPVVLGVRPEHLRFTVHGDHSHHHFDINANVGVTEFLGDQIIVHAQSASGEPITARVGAPAQLEAKQSITFSVRPEDFCFFEPEEFGRRIREDS